MIRINAIWVATEPMDMRAGKRWHQEGVLPVHGRPLVAKLPFRNGLKVKIARVHPANSPSCGRAPLN
jgi:hypothetical protein